MRDTGWNTPDETDYGWNDSDEIETVDVSEINWDEVEKVSSNVQAKWDYVDGFNQIVLVVEQTSNAGIKFIGAAIELD